MVEVELKKGAHWINLSNKFGWDQLLAKDIMLLNDLENNKIIIVIDLTPNYVGSKTVNNYYDMEKYEEDWSILKGVHLTNEQIFDRFNRFVSNNCNADTQLFIKLLSKQETLKEVKLESSDELKLLIVE